MCERRKDQYIKSGKFEMSAICHILVDLHQKSPSKTSAYYLMKAFLNRFAR